jgi:hypothetical protein
MTIENKCLTRGCRAIKRYFVPGFDIAIDVCKDCDRIVNTITGRGELTKKAFENKRRDA